MSTFYKVRQIGTKLFYSPPSMAVGAGGFDKKGKRYIDLMNAQNAATFCNPVACEVVQYIETVLEIGTISEDGKLTVSLNQLTE